MEYHLKDLIDISLLQELLDKLDSSFSFGTAILDNNGNVLTASGWQDICVKFHRVHPIASNKCTECDLYVLKHLSEDKKFISYSCSHGLVDTATPIYVDGKHLGSFYIGQFFTKEPDYDFFTKQAQFYGFDVEAYLKAVSEVPIISEEQVEKNLNLTTSIVHIISGIAEKRLHELEQIKELNEKEERLQLALFAANQGAWEYDIKNDTFTINKAFAESIGLEIDKYELTIRNWQELLHPDYIRLHNELFTNYLKGKSLVYESEYRIITRYGWKWIRSCGKIVEWDDNRNPLRLVGIHTNIDQLKQREEEINNLNQNLENRVVQRTNELKAAIDESDRFFTIALDLLCIAGIDGRFKKINTSWERTLGYTREELFSKTFLEFIHPEDIQSTRNAIKELSDQKQVIGFVNRYRCKNGTYRWIEWRSAPAGDLIYAAARDITERMNAEEELRNEQTFTNAVMDSIPGLLYLYDDQGRLVRWNKQHELITGYSSSELANMTLLDWYRDSKQDIEVITAGVQRTMEQGYGEAIGNLQTKSGQKITFNFTAVKLEINHRTYFAGIGIDITERLKAEKALRESEERNRLVIQASNEGVWDWDLQTNYVYYSPRWKEMLGYAEYELEDTITTWYKVIHPDDLLIAQNFLKDHFEKNLPFHHLSRFKHKNGTWRWIQVNGVALRDNTNKPYRMIGNHLDITDRKEVEEKMVQLNTTKDKFFSIIAHDLKNPLISIIGLTELLSEKIKNKDFANADDYVNNLLKASQNGLDLLQNLLQWSRAQTKGIEFNPQYINLKSIIDECIETIEFQAVTKQITIKKWIDHSMTIFADDDLLKTILRNILTNAVKYSYANGEIMVRATETHKTISISVTDNGIGIEPHALENMFQIGNIYSSPGTHSEIGTGLGLILCKEFVEMHGGDIVVKSELGKGSEFTVILPKYKK